MILNKLKLWTISLANRRTAPHWLGFIAFIESSFFPIPVDILYIPLLLIRQNRVYRYALIATICSVLGGIAGWFIGHFAYDTLAKPILEFYGKVESFESLKNNATLQFLIILLITSGFFHLPPIKIVTILAGVMNVHLELFILICIFSRGARFYLLAWLIKHFGQKAMNFLRQHFKWIILMGCVSLLLIYGIFIVFLNKQLL
ncbi:YqaA family protein [Bartonella krasnovii]|uniref:DedA family protein n=1 Tax=Bartonella krasnovii TaxID=2267275 RepID=A0A5B9D2N4_9HYPH|nr:YqaA family protein [Bartonella krasnovii]QEE12758.1 DedA family protein [Bartonella krasnovii]UNF28874.1 DedA family protein [Bartonella krasnovii]UNF35240.1 DedA family protein [Bartonella krasnovii]UNF36868.1 DedA family protein [Bartonella krasnovii]UNF38554.1 DedA family protein [Bartonella krasnovii]